MGYEVVYDRRKSQRARTLLNGVIRHTSKLSTMNCTVRNLSDGGARLEVANSNWLPDRFELEVTGRDIRRAARTAWRANGLAGVHFTGEEGAAEGFAREEVARLKDENEKLGRRLKDLAE